MQRKIDFSGNQSGSLGKTRIKIRGECLKILRPIFIQLIYKNMITKYDNPDKHDNPIKRNFSSNLLESFSPF